MALKRLLPVLRFVSRQSFSASCRDIRFLCRDMFGLGQTFLGHDKDFLVGTEPPASMLRHGFPCVMT